MIDLYETTRTRYARQLFICKFFSIEFMSTDSVFLSFFVFHSFAWKEMEAAMKGN